MATVVVIEDEPAIALLVSTKLRNAGHDVLVATDGEAGYTLAIEAQPDIVLLDIMLPRADGYTVCRRIRAHHDPGRGPVIVLLSARSQATDHLRGVESGCDEFITKPFRPAELLERVNALIERNERQEPLQP